MRSRTAKKDAQQQARDAADAAKSVAADLGQIVSMQAAQQASEQDKQALLVFLAASPVIAGRNGWVVKNGSDAPISNVQVSATAGGSVMVVYRNTGVDQLNVYQEPALGPGESTTMFRPLEYVVPHPPEIEQIRFIFTDARDVRWGRIGTAKPTRLSDAD